MRPFRIAATRFAIALFILLPLYEVADRGEHWPNDGHYVSLVLFVLFSAGVVLAARMLSSSASERSVAVQALEEGPRDGMLSDFTRAARNRVSSVSRTHISLRTGFKPGVPPESAISGIVDSPRFLVLRDFRI